VGDGGGTAHRPDGAPGAEAVAYFRAIEDAFVRLRGAPLLLSPTDFQVAAGWQREGVPLPLVLATLEEVFAKRQERGTRGRINSLRYCAPAVAAAWEELRELQGPARATEVPEVDVAERLRALVDALPAELPERAAWAVRVAGVAAAAVGPEAVEEALRSLDEALMTATEAALTPGGRAAVEAEVAAIVDGLRDRFTDAELTALHRQLFRQRLRRRAALPVLTLFG
jgi:hypothetical protein